MKGSPRSLWLSAINRASGWWMGQAANAMRQAQTAAMKAALKPKPARKPRKKK
ncbi:hypothetical protein QWZ14_25545 [Paeniroseomonas aquatica]|uniref:Uncharacterized protein n=1 Tax=Paeniroseomonas aquatica TaxID=373043 RepID=A0ABT8AD67_9PROT|nr:hypothetical protein [Paeniroseomonas aquatica]MDN3567757.1 hypothetical protein [Paeniroseomonas aquatica]